MASISRRGDGWRAQIYRAGTRESRTFATRAEAADWAALREAEIVRGEATGSAHTFARGENWTCVGPKGCSSVTCRRSRMPSPPPSPSDAMGAG